MSKYKITNPEYGIYNVFRWDDGLNEWALEWYYPKYSVNLRKDFASLEEAKEYVKEAKELDKKQEEYKKLIDAWKPMEDLIL